MPQVLELEKKLEILRKRTRLDLSLNDLRIILGCFRAVEYQAKLDGEQYLDIDAVALKSRLETLYSKMLKEHGNNGSSD